MALRIFPLLIFAVLAVGGNAKAQNLDGTPLASCPGYIANHHLVSELQWSVNCLLQGIRDKDKAIVAALSGPTRCMEKHPCDGPLDAYSSELIFGLNGSGKTEAGYPSLSARLAKAKSVLIITNPNPSFRNYVTVKFIPKPGKNQARARDALHKNLFFETNFIYDEARSIWVDNEFFHFETDYLQDVYDAADVVDLSGDDSALPVLVWKPKR